MVDINEYLDQLKNLDRNNIGSWPLWIYGLFLAAAIILVFAASYYFVIKSNQQTLKQAEQHTQELKREFRNKHERVAYLPQYREQFKTLQKELRGLVAELPSKTEVPELLRDVSNTRAANGLVETLFKPESQNKHEFYVALPNHLVVKGGYHDLARFVSRVAELSRIVTIDHVNIHPVDDNPGQLKMKATLKTYQHLDNATL